VTEPAPEVPAPAGPDPSGPPRRRRRPSGRRRALFVLVLVALALLVAEGLARLLVERPGPIYQDHPYLRRVRAPGSTHDLVNPLTGEAFTLRVDAYGFRATDLPPPGTPKPPGTYRIFFVGASTTENVALPDEETFPVLVGERLNAALGGEPQVVTANTALSGNSIADSFALIGHRLLALEPDLIVVLHAINDMRAGLSERFDPTHYAERRSPEPPSLGDWAEDRSQLLWLLDRLGDRIGQRSIADKYRARRQGVPFTEGVDPTVGLPHFRRYLRLIAAVCRAEGVPLALMTMPSLYREGLTAEEDAALWMGYLNHGELNLDNATLRRGMAAFNAAIREQAAAEGALLIDLEAAVPKDLEHLYDDCHYTARGNAVVAEAIAAALLEGDDLP